MIRSMTGFAAATREDERARAQVTVKSVNHRFLDVVVKGPTSLAALDTRVRALAQERLARGRLDVLIGVEHLVPPTREATLDVALLEKIVRAINMARDKGLVSGPLTPADVLRLPQVLEVRQAAGEESADDPSGGVQAIVEAAVADALDALVAMRATEGGYLATDLVTRLATLAGMVDGLERLAAEGQAAVTSRLRERIDALPVELRADPSAVAQEIVRFVARSDINEEIVRMRGHLDHWRALSEGAEPCGRKLDFLVQEMNREINTIGSKAEGGRATETVIAAKAELERIREQVQNVE